MKKNLIMIFVDIIMYAYLFVLEVISTPNSKLYNMIGIVFFTFFMLHNVFNLNQIVSIINEKTKINKGIYIVVTGLLSIAIFFAIASNAFLPNTVYAVDYAQFPNIVSKVHVLSYSWTLLLVAVHIGIMLPAVVRGFMDKVSKNKFKYLVYLLVAVFCLFGISFFMVDRIYEDLFGITEYKYASIKEVSYYLTFINMSLAISILTGAVIQFKNWYSNKSVLN